MQSRVDSLSKVLTDFIPPGELRSEEVAAALKQEVEAAKAQIDEELQVSVCVTGLSSAATV
jgi:hypothetical protein